jgi:hypothetical protein
MNKEFVPYEQALALKELGFDEQCFSFYDSDGGLYESEGYYKKGYNVSDEEVIAPLYQQAFRWFREKYKVSPIITCYSELRNAWKYHIPNEGGEQGFNTYEEAELACLKKLIEIVKENKQ